MAQVAYKYTWTLPRLHGLDNYSLGMNLNWHGHKSGLDKISCSINFAHFSGVKIIFYFPTFHTWVVFFISLNCFRAKNTFFVSCFQAAYRHRVPRSVYHERCRLKLAAAALCTTGNRHTVRRRHPTHCSNADVSCFSEIIFCGYSYMISMLFYFCSARMDNLFSDDKLVWTLKCMGDHMFYLSLENFITLYHQLATCVFAMV